EKIDGTLEDIFTLQDKLAHAILGHLSLRAPTPAAPKPMPLGRAYELYTRASSLVTRVGREDLDQAVELRDDAICLDADSGPAHAALAQAYAFRAISTGAPDDLDRSAAAADRALALDPRNEAAHRWKGYVLWRRGLWREAEPILRRAIELN